MFAYRPACRQPTNQIGELATGYVALSTPRSARIAPPITIPRMPDRYRCGSCGNLTRFDVVGTRRTRAFHHYSIGGELTVEEEDVLEERVEQVTCRWCGATGDSIERVPVEESA